MNDPLVHFLTLNTLMAAVLVVMAHVCAWARVRPQLVHGLWLAALVKLIVPSFVPIPLLPAPLPDKVEVIPVLALTVEWRPSTMPSTATEDVPDHTGPSQVGATVSEWRIRPWLLGAWAVGSAGWVALALRRMRRFQHLLGSAVAMTETHPRVYLIDATISPLLWAFMGRAQIILPKALVAALSPAELQAVIEHEQVHFRRRDHWVRWVEFMVLAAVWWHPLAWWITRRLRAAEEACCDTEVAADMTDRRPYATALLRTALFLSNATTPPRHATGIGEAASIKKRLQHIMTLSASRRASKLATMTVLCFTALAVVAMPVEKAAQSVPEPPVDLPEAAPRPEPAPEVPGTLEAPPITDPAPPASLDLLPPSAGSAANFSPETHYLDAYIKVQEAEGRRKAGDHSGAENLFREALSRFEAVRSKAPNWQPNMVGFRIGLVQRELGLESAKPSLLTETTIQSPVASVSGREERVGFRTEFGGSLLRVTADRLDMTTPDGVPGRSRTTTFTKGEANLSVAGQIRGEIPVLVGAGSIRAAWGKWRMIAERAEVRDSTIVLTGDAVLVVLDSENRPTTILKGNHMTLDLQAQALVVKGDAVGFFDRSLGSFWSAEGEESSMEFSLSKDGQSIQAIGRRARKMELNLRERARSQYRAQLLEKWPGLAAIDAELAPLLPATGEAAPSRALPESSSPRESNAPRQETVPKEGTSQKNLPR
jgi:beta-lactamase regulating signal transducer with metallopeptidase domain